MFPPLHSTSVSHGEKFGGKPRFKQASTEPTPVEPRPVLSTAYASIVELNMKVLTSTKRTNAVLVCVDFMVLCISILHTDSIKGDFLSYDLFTLFFSRSRLFSRMLLLIVTPCVYA